MKTLLDEPSWVEQEFGDHDLIKAGLVHSSELTLADQLAMLHACHVLNTVYRFRARLTSLDFFPSKSLNPEANVLISKQPGLGAAVVSLGMLRLLGVLCARITLMHEKHDEICAVIERADVGHHVKEFPGDGLKGFNISKAKEVCCGLTDAEIERLAARGKSPEVAS